MLLIVFIQNCTRSMLSVHCQTVAIIIPRADPKSPPPANSIRWYQYHYHYFIQCLGTDLSEVKVKGEGGEVRVTKMAADILVNISSLTHRSQFNCHLSLGSAFWWCNCGKYLTIPVFCDEITAGGKTGDVIARCICDFSHRVIYFRNAAAAAAAAAPLLLL